MRPDSTSQEIKTENAYLDVVASKSVFYGEKNIQRDSIMTRMRSTGNFDRSQMQNLRSNINYVIEKDRETQKITFKDRIGRDAYIYEEDRSFNWKILPETTQNGIYKVQKAETSFGGRTWIAWFTQDVPVMDGPYKFSGLPGLIVKIEDSKGDYSFDLKESKKIAALPTLQQRGNIVKLKRSDFEKQTEKFRKDPSSFFYTWNINPPTSNGGGFRMQQMDPQRVKQMQQRMLDEIKKNNNPIEFIK